MEYRSSRITQEYRRWGGRARLAASALGATHATAAAPRSARCAPALVQPHAPPARGPRHVYAIDKADFLRSHGHHDGVCAVAFAEEADAIQQWAGGDAAGSEHNVVAGR